MEDPAVPGTPMNPQPGSAPQHPIDPWSQQMDPGVQQQQQQAWQPLQDPGAAQWYGPPAPAPKKKRRGLIITLSIVGGLIGLIVVAVGVLIVGNLITYQAALNDEEAALSDLPPAEEMIPATTNTFLDSRYSAGYREYSFPEIGEPLGITDDGTRLLVFKEDPEILSNITRTNELLAVDVSTGDSSTLGTFTRCSNITPRDTVFCALVEQPEPTEIGGQVFQDPLTILSQSLQEVDARTGEVLHESPIRDTAAAGRIAYLGDSGDDAVLSLTLQNGIGQPTYSVLQAFDAKTREASWTYDFFDDDDDVDIVTGCALVEEGATVACAETVREDSGASDALADPSPYAVVSVDAGTGTRIAKFGVGEQARIAVEGVLSSGFNLNDDATATVFDFEGNAVEELVGSDEANPAELIPTQRTMSDPNLYEERLVPYPMSATRFGGVGVKIVVDAQGGVVLDTKPGDIEDEGNGIRRVSDGEVLFHGRPIATTADGSAVVAESNEGTLETGPAYFVNIETGKKTVIDMDPEVDSVLVENGLLTLIDLSGERPTRILLPGA